MAKCRRYREYKKECLTCVKSSNNFIIRQRGFVAVIGVIIFLFLLALISFSIPCENSCIQFAISFKTYMIEVQHILLITSVTLISVIIRFLITIRHYTISCNW